MSYWPENSEFNSYKVMDNGKVYFFMTFMKSGNEGYRLEKTF